jgi:hypothetical protein
MKKQTFDFGLTSELTGKTKSSFYDRLQHFKQMQSLLERVNELMNQDDVDIMDSTILKLDIEQLLNDLKK